MSNFFTNIIQELFSGNMGNWGFCSWFIVNALLSVIHISISYAFQWWEYLIQKRDPDFKPELIYNGPEQAAGCIIFFGLVVCCLQKTGFIILCFCTALMIIDKLGDIYESYKCM